VTAALRTARHLASLLVLAFCAALPQSPSVALADPSSPDRLVTRVVDGDTMVLDGGEKVRLIGVDTPETVHPNKPVERFGKEASAFTTRMAEGKHVRLEYDQERRDRYGRTLAYVYLPDGTLVNLEIIRQGYGFAYTRFPFSKLEEFRSGERQAREQGRGLWAEANGQADKGAPEVKPRSAHVPSQEAKTPGSSCIPREQCCKVCSGGQACGASCISRSYTCRKGKGCACDSVDLCQ